MPTTYTLIAQTIGLAGMAFNVLSYQQKKQRNIILFQLFGGALFAVNYFMLGAIVGGCMNVLAVLRAVVFANKQTFRAEHPAWLWGFMTCYGLSYLLTFTSFGQPWNWYTGILELLPIIGMVALTIGFRCKNARDVRRLGLINSPAWLIYNCANLTIGGILCEVLSLGSIVIGMLRLDRRTDKAEKDDA